MGIFEKARAGRQPYKLWTVYHDRFGLKGYIARLRVPRKGGYLITDTLFVAETLEQMRDALSKSGLVLWEVKIDFDPDIIEVWV